MYHSQKLPSAFEDFFKDINAEVNIWDTELSDYNIKFKFIKGVKTLAENLSGMTDLNLRELNSPEYRRP